MTDLPPQSETLITGGKHHLAPQATPFIGRAEELTELATLLTDPACRLLTLVGTGGIGKTRLALEVARIVSLADGVYVIPLQPLSSPAMIVTAIVDLLPFSLVDNDEPRTQLLDYLHHKEMLLVLDNFEHLMDGVDLLIDILENAPRVKLLVTSRERLRLHEEWVFDVAGLIVPENDQVDALESYSAPQLFIESARRAGHKFQPEDAIYVIRICQLVEGIPLAIELSASWVRTLPCHTIAQEIEANLDILATNVRNFPEKHRSMRAVFSQSLALCTTEEQTIFCRLAVFQGGFEREAAQQVVGATLAVLASLVDRSLLRVTHDGRYSLHELLRQFGAHQLDESPKEASQTHDRHCAYYASLMQAQWPRLSGSEIKAALTTINVELNNVRAAWDWAVSHRQAAEVEAMLTSLWFFCGVSTHYQEGVQIFANAVPAFSDNMAVHGKLMARWGELVSLTGAFSKSHALLQESLPLLRQVGGRSYIAFVLYRLMWISLNASEKVPESVVHLEESLALYTELNDDFGRGEVLVIWGYFYLNRYRAEQQADALQHAQHCFQQALAAFQVRKSVFGFAISHLGLFEVAALHRDYRYALHCVQVSRKIFHDLGIPWGIMWALAKESLAAYKLGDYALARQCILENLLLNLERGVGFNQHQYSYTAERLLRSLHLAAAILIAEGKQKRGYELLGFVGQKYLEPDRSAFFLPAPVDDVLPAILADLPNQRPVRDLESVVKEVIADLSTTPSPEASQPLLPYTLLSAREKEIIQLTIDGFNSREVAEQLVLGVNTVRWYLRQIYDKLDVHSRAELIARTRELELLG